MNENSPLAVDAEKLAAYLRTDNGRALAALVREEFARIGIRHPLPYVLPLAEFYTPDADPDGVKLSA